MPRATPSEVSPAPCGCDRRLADDAVSALATPKSVTTATPWESSTLSGLMSRCTTPCGVGVGQRRGDVAQHPHRLGHGQLAVAQQAGAERLAVHERHGEVGQARRLAGGEEGDDVGMLELGGEEDLAAEPVHAHAGRELGQ